MRSFFRAVLDVQKPVFYRQRRSFGKKTFADYMVYTETGAMSVSVIKVTILSRATICFCVP